VAYGCKTCSQRFKIAPQDKFVNNWEPAKQQWADGGKVTKLIGYDTGESHRSKKDYSDEKYLFRHPLIEWSMGRAECIEGILQAGLCLPGKSACFFCPNSKPSEIRQLASVYPDLMDRAIAMEKNAELTHIKGLGRSYAWKDIIATSDMFSDHHFYTPEITCDCFDG
jgi:hypothetical protein